MATLIVSGTLSCITSSFQNVEVPVYYGPARDRKGQLFPAVQNNESFNAEAGFSAMAVQSSSAVQSGNKEEKMVMQRITSPRDRASVQEIKTNVWLLIAVPWMFGMATQNLKIEVDHPESK